ncbi:hypothetical protein [uncultured Cytophaga sp.]|nr:hypothetical protein [uncultured Cytophaga sp.]
MKKTATKFEIKSVKDIVEVKAYIKKQMQSGKPIDESKMKGIKFASPL